MEKSKYVILSRLSRAFRELDFDDIEYQMRRLREVNFTRCGDVMRAAADAIEKLKGADDELPKS